MTAQADPDSLYRALVARDRRFDGVFFVGVTTTGVYCRPICPARTPGQPRCRFFTRAAEAERAGFRACFRCRPELAPGRAPVDATSTLARRAATRIEAGYLNERSLEDLSDSLGVTSRHLRRSVQDELGVSPVELAQTHRLAMAKRLLADTRLSLADVAFASGFASIRRFNAAFLARFGAPPSRARRSSAAAPATEPAGGSSAIALRLDYRPPLDWASLLGFLGARAIPGVERVHGGTYARCVTVGDLRGHLRVCTDPVRDALIAHVSWSLAPRLPEVVRRLRAQLDLDASPTVIAEHLRRDVVLRAQVDANPGMRLPGAFDPFESVVRAVLGQQVSVAAATTLAGRVAARFGEAMEGCEPGLARTFPSAETLAREEPSAIAGAVGLPEARARTLVAVARAIAEGHLDLSGETEAEAAVSTLLAIPGIGPWTAQYVAMRVLRWPDAFPAGDLGVKKALGVASTREAEARAEPWRPWRAYAVMFLWSSLASGGR